MLVIVTRCGIGRLVLVAQLVIFEGVCVCGSVIPVSNGYGRNLWYGVVVGGCVGCGCVTYGYRCKLCGWPCGQFSVLCVCVCVVIGVELRTVLMVVRPNNDCVWYGW